MSARISSAKTEKPKAPYPSTELAIKEDSSLVGEVTSSDTDPSLQDHEPGPSPLSWKEAAILLDTIPGVHQRAAEGILAEIGLDMSRFPTPGHLADVRWHVSWQ